ncbi:asparaginase [Virgibacillus sp. 179-BFC.A HS]|uniref:asparaginase n=1 Tax=Tigheibacillus jepli TaxID=3035914 RepID=A0ABU5CH81_9BACI|nr:asparaginase [Virgibacillus sp. 179-BFC.A HS]MDY0405684.1 asparaginase [Virgibacillus sp. 179-BFC.A HS]
MKKILIVHTGGTISMVEDKRTGSVHPTDRHPLSGISELFDGIADVDENIIFSFPSPQITLQHMLKLANFIKDNISKYDGFVITHGTDTLEETAYFLDLVLHIKKPVIITGAMRSSNEIGSDALYNLIASVRTAMCEKATNQGVLVVMNDEIHTAANVTKTSTSNIATFQSPQFGPIGIITKDSVLFHHQILPKRVFDIQQLTKKVHLLKAFAGMDHELIDAVHALKPDGLVIEGLGQGNLPKNTISALKKMMDDNIALVLVSRCYQGIVQPTYGYEGGGKQLKEMGVIFTNGLTGPKARIKLMIALEYTDKIEQVRQYFEEEM